ncbi:NB-ARC domain-containing protein [Actinomycetota bacterium Odt1-20B]
MGGHTNEIGGGAQLSGVTVQAGAVHGGIHAYLPQAAVPTPRQLLPVPAHFTDREGDLAALGRLATRRSGQSAGTRLVVVTGPAGVGKTSLVTRWLRTAQGEFPDGQLYADLRGHTVAGAAPPGEILGQFLRALYAGQVPHGLAERTALWRSLTEELRLAVMLDNVSTAAQARPLFPGSGRSLVAVTSRRLLTGLRIDGAEFHTLGVMPPAAAEELLIRGIGRERVESDTASARRVLSLCAGLPLAVCVASARLAARPRQPVRVLADALARERDRLSLLAVDGEAAVRSALDDSYRGLSAPAARLYRCLGQLPTPLLDSHVAAAAAGLPLSAAEGLLDVLVEANLLEDTGPDQYRFHDLIRLHAQERGAATDSGEDDGDPLRRVGDWYLATVTEAEKMITPAQFTLDRDYVHRPSLEPVFTTEPDALTWLDHHRMNLMALLRTAADRSWHTLVWQLVDAMWPLFLRLRHYDSWIEAHELGLVAARHAGHAAAERQMLNSGAIGLGAAQRTEDAIVWYRQSREAARRGGDRRDEGQALLGLGGAYFEEGRLPEAMTYLEQAVAAWVETGYARGEGLAGILLAEVALARDEPHRAVELLTTARATLLAVDDPHDAARALAFLGRAHARAGEHTTGMRELGLALGVFEDSGAAHWQARTLEMLGQTAAEGGDEAAARGHYERALALCVPISLSDADRVNGRLAALAPAAPKDAPSPAAHQHVVQEGREGE